MEIKKSYERATLAVLHLNVKDVITTSGVMVDGDTTIVLPEDIF